MMMVAMVVMPMVMMAMVVMVVTVSSRGTSRERRQAERDGGGESEQCSASEHGRSFWSFGLSIRTIGRETVPLRSSL